jgi:tetratricopeptide (TPR) repeat protein
MFTFRVNAHRIRIRGAVMALAGLLLIGLGPPVQAQSLQDAQTAYDARNYDETISVLRTVLSNKKKNDKAHYLLGMALKRKGLSDEALSEFLIAVKEQKKNHDARYELGMLQIEKEQFEDAVKTLAEGVKRTKDKEPRFFYAQGQLAIAQEDINRAMVLMNRARSEQPDNPLFIMGLADLYAAQKVWGLAITNLRQALAMNPNSPDVAMIHHKIGQLHFNARQWNEAYAAYKKATEVDPAIKDAWYQQGYIQFVAQRFSLVVEPMEKFVALEPDNAEAYFMLAESLNKTKRIKMAVPHYKKVIQLAPDKTEAYLPMGNGMVAEGMYSEAVSAYKEAVSQNPDNAMLYYSLGWVQTQADVGQYDDGVLNLKKSLEIDGTSEKPHIQLALVYFDQAKYPDAIPHLKEAIRLNPNDQNPYAYYGRSFIKQGQFGDAVNALKEVLEPAIQSQEDEEGVKKLSNVYFTLGQEIYKESREIEKELRAPVYTAALDMYRAKTAHDTTSYATYLNMGLAGLVSSEGEVARDALIRAIDLRKEEAVEDPKIVLQAIKFLGTSYLIMEDYGNARKTFNRVLEIDPEDHEAYYRLGFDRVLNKDWGGAIARLKKAVELKPDNASYHLLLAQAYTNSQQLGPAIRHYNESLKINPNNSNAREQLQQVRDIYEQQKGN